MLPLNTNGSKAAAVDPAEAVAKAVETAQGAADAAGKAAALQPVLDLFADPSATEAIVAEASAVLGEVGGLLAAAAAEECTAELATSIATGTHLITSFAEAGAAGPAASSCVPPVVTLLAAPGPDMSDEKSALLTSACTAAYALASTPPGRSALRKADVPAALLALLQPAYSSHRALLAQVALTVGRLAESALSRAAFGSEANLPLLLSSLTILATPPTPTEALSLRLHAKLLLMLGFCLYDGSMLTSLLDGGLLKYALANLNPPPADPDAEAPPADALQCAQELRSNSATVIAIAGQSAPGRDLLISNRRSRWADHRYTAIRYRW